MKCINTILFCILICCVILPINAQSILVDDTQSAQQLVKGVLVNSTCANVSNFSVTGDRFTSGQNSYGYFNSQGGSFPFKEGVVLSTWSSIHSPGPFKREPSSGPNSGSSSWVGDFDLEQALGTTNTSNATVLEFDFTAITNTISFNYLFASNEYQDDFPCNFSDGFAFLIKETGTATYKNLAVLPGSSTPVSSKNVHPSITFNGNLSCSAANESYFGSLNTSPTNTSPINYSGQTAVMNAQSTVTPGKTYHIKLVIADQNGYYYDSAVFIEAGSFISKIDLGSNKLLATNTGICFGENYVIDTNLPATNTYKWYKDGSSTPIPGESQPFYTAKEAGTYKVVMGDTNCLATGEIKIEFTPEIVLKNTTLVQCDDNGDGIAVFDLTKAEPIIKNNNTTLGSMFFYENILDAQNNQNPILTPNNYTNKSNNQIVIAKVSDNNLCANYAELTLSISNQTIAPPPPTIVCDIDGNSDGIYQIDLMTIATSGHFSGIGTNIFVDFYLDQSDASLERNKLPTLFRNTIPYQQTIYARITNGSDCYAITSIELIVNTFNPPNFQEEKTFLCSDSSLDLSVDTGFSSYLWNTGANTNTINVTTSGNYSVTVSNTDGCTATKNFTISASEIATITGVTINDFAGNGNSVLIKYTGAGNYEFSLDGTIFQDSPLFNAVAPGEYFVYVQDKNGCGISQAFKIFILDYPRFFTPNGDGYNDTWKINNLNLLPKSTITIFDRYGKFLKVLSESSPEWNGAFNGYALPADDYWFHLNFVDGKVIKGHFSLKR